MLVMIAAKKTKHSCALVVEDEANARDILTEFLHSEGFEVAHARDGVDALSYVYARAPAVVLLDLMMPRMSGLEVIDQIRHDSVLARIPIVAMSSASDLLTRALDFGADAAVPKPLDLPAFARLLDRYRG
jgi:chemosensory pili system protein ChpA (sensor histidine kinase/response regulator)